MQQVALQGQVEGLIADWCATNGFGSDPVTVSTFIELATKLLTSLLGGLSMASVRPNLRPRDEDSVSESITDYLVNNNALSSFAQEEDPRASRGQQQDGPAQGLCLILACGCRRGA